MRFQMYILLFFLLISCKNQNYYGYIYDIDTKKPLNKVFVRENFKNNAKFTYSDENGFFKIENNTESIGDLIFNIEGYKTDTIVTIWSQHGEKLKYRFVGNNSDTLFMKKK